MRLEIALAPLPLWPDRKFCAHRQNPAPSEQPANRRRIFARPRRFILGARPRRIGRRHEKSKSHVALGALRTPIEPGLAHLAVSGEPWQVNVRRIVSQSPRRFSSPAPARPPQDCAFSTIAPVMLAMQV